MDPGRCREGGQLGWCNPSILESESEFCPQSQEPEPVILPDSKQKDKSKNVTCVGFPLCPPFKRVQEVWCLFRDRTSQPKTHPASPPRFSLAVGEFLKD